MDLKYPSARIRHRDCGFAAELDKWFSLGACLRRETLRPQQFPIAVDKIRTLQFGQGFRVGTTTRAIIIRIVTLVSVFSGKGRHQLTRIFGRPCGLRRDAWWSQRAGRGLGPRWRAGGKIAWEYRMALFSSILTCVAGPNFSPEIAVSFRPSRYARFSV
jgi:hypothetical protein